MMACMCITTVITLQIVGVIYRVLTVGGVKMILLVGVKEGRITGIIYCACVIRIWLSQRCKACGWVIACPNPTHPQKEHLQENQGLSIRVKKIPN